MRIPETRIAFRGEVHCVSEWARRIGIARKTLTSRLRKGWPLERALNGELSFLSRDKKLQILSEIELGRNHRPKKLAVKHGLSQQTIYKIWRYRDEIRK